MKKDEIKIGKKAYVRPAVEKVKIDKGISMVMQSTPPGDPPAGKSTNPFR